MKRCIMGYMKFPPLICHPCLVLSATESCQKNLTTAVDTLTSLVSRCKNDFHDWKCRQGIWRSAQTTYNILSRCARYAETSIKLSSLITEDNLNDDSVQQLFAIQQAQILYVQEENSVLVLQSHFDESTARIFRLL